jgi:hypothetical protein
VVGGYHNHKKKKTPLPIMSEETRRLLDGSCSRSSLPNPLPSSPPGTTPAEDEEVASSRLVQNKKAGSSGKKKQPQTKSTTAAATTTRPPLLSCLVYALVNVVIAVPGLFGYAAVIFKAPVFHPYRNQLAKIVISSSLVHQLGFTLFSSLPFAIGTVQDAGLVFLSAMSSTIADRMMMAAAQEKDDVTTNDAAILSTTLVLLSLGTAVLGLVLMALGKFQLANAVSFLPFGTCENNNKKYIGSREFRGHCTFYILTMANILCVQVPSAVIWPILVGSVSRPVPLWPFPLHSIP